MAGFFTSPTVQAALLVGGLVAVVTAVVGTLTVTRGQSFAGHALADLGAVGGSGAYLVGISQLWGFIAAGIIAALLMELIGIRRLRGRDIATGVVFGLGMGFTALFLFLDTTVAGSGNSTVTVLFGSLFVLDPQLIFPIVLLAGVALLLTGIVYRWLLLDAVDPNVAFARGVPVRAAGVMFLIALALAVALSSLTVGAILSTALLIGPASTALQTTRRIGAAAILAAVIGVVVTWAGCLLSYQSHEWAGPGGNWPVSFCIVALIFVLYLTVRSARHIHHRFSRPAGVREMSS